jgi:hypothetical protein
VRRLALALGLLSLSVADSGEAQQQRRCQESRTPGKLPAAGLLLDSARAVSELTARELPAEGLLFSLVYNEDDSLPQARRLDSTGTALADILAKSLHPQAPTGYWGVRVRVVGGATPGLSLERSQYCPPVAASIQARPRQFIAAIRMGDRERPVGSTVRFIADADVSETGQVWEISLLRPSGVREIAEEILHNVRIRRFMPATLDGTPVPGRVRVEGRTEKLWERVSDHGLEAAFSITMVP